MCGPAYMEKRTCIKDMIWTVGETNTDCGLANSIVLMASSPSEELCCSCVGDGPCSLEGHGEGLGLSCLKITLSFF